MRLLRAIAPFLLGFGMAGLDNSRFNLYGIITAIAIVLLINQSE